ncbi:unnamed protein product, partial [Brenthis ino]
MFIQDGESYASYNNTFIRRIKFDSDKPEVLDGEKYNDYNNHSTFYCKERDNYDENIKTEPKDNRKYNVCITPIYLKDVRVMKTTITKNVGKRKPIYRNGEGICPYCGKRMKITRKHLLLHTAERKFKCNECSRSFYTKKDLESHIKYHSKEPAFKCHNCIAVFQTKATLARHMLIHTNVKDFKCQICSKAFKWKNGLLRHMQIHNISREFKCEICEMSFSTKYGFQHHTRVHTGERPYKCELCSRPYSYKRDFNKHCLKKHGVVIDRRPVRVMNEQVLQKEKALMKNLMLKLHGMPTENDPREAFKGPQGAQAFTKALKLLQTCPLQIDVHL